MSPAAVGPRRAVIDTASGDTIEIDPETGEILAEAKGAFRPLGELEHEDPDELRLAVSGRIVLGRLLKGVITPASRTFLEWSDGRWVACTPDGWRAHVRPAAIGNGQ